jgi:hypothetical protein
VEVAIAAEITLHLNTHRQLPLVPAQLFVSGDSLYMTDGDERIKFSERALMKLSTVMDFTEDGYLIRIGGRRHRIRDAGCQKS